MKKKAFSLASKYGFESENITEIKNFFSKRLIHELKTGQNICNLKFLDNTMQRLKKIELLDYHALIAKRQRDSYNFWIKNFSKDTLFIELDFKMKIKIGMGPQQCSQEFYNQKSRFCLGNYYLNFFYILAILSSFTYDRLFQKYSSV